MAFARYYVDVRALGATTPIPFTAGAPWVAVAVRGFDKQSGRSLPAVALRTQRGGAELDVSQHGDPPPPPPPATWLFTNCASLT